jgi:hypothetical protein
MSEPTIPIPVSTLQRVAEYLSGQPYRDVAQLLALLQAAADAANQPQPAPAEQEPDAITQ